MAGTRRAELERMADTRPNTSDGKDAAPPGIAKLDYAPPPRKEYKSGVDKWVERLTPPADPEMRSWWFGRVGYRVVLSLICLAIAFYFGPNLIQFGRLTKPKMADYIPIVERTGVPFVKAIKLFKLDHGRYPKNETELIPNYLRETSAGFTTLDGEVVGFIGYDEWVHYNFTPGAEGWDLSGPYFNGRMPLPPVTIGPTDRSQTQPGI
jgi:hypothetical protein